MAGETLTEDTLPVGSAVTPVGDPAPEGEGEVGRGSAQTVEASRFNGLMSQHQKTLTRMQALEAELQELKNQPKETAPVTDDAVRNEVAELREIIMEERIENARLKVLRDHPEIQPFADLIVGNSPKEVAEIGKEIASRMKAVVEAQKAGAAPATQTPVTESAPAPQAEAAPEPPVTGGGAAFDSGASTDDRVANALKKGKAGWSDYLQAKYERAVERGEIEGLELVQAS